jgi:mannitol/fructose-specific phosphotransferase system IIA component (Ntr-type)
MITLHQLADRLEHLVEQLRHSEAGTVVPELTEELWSTSQQIASITGPAFACPHCGAAL